MNQTSNMEILRELTSKLNLRDKRLREINKMFDRFFDFPLSSELMCIFDFDGRFVKLNSRWKEVLQCSVSELLEDCYTKLIHPDDVESTKQAILQAQDKPITFINRYQRKDGSYVKLEWCSSPPDTELQVIYAIAKIVD